MRHQLFGITKILLGSRFEKRRIMKDLDTIIFSITQRAYPITEIIMKKQ